MRYDNDNKICGIDTYEKFFYLFMVSMVSFSSLDTSSQPYIVVESV